jgi:phage-related protein
VRAFPADVRRDLGHQLLRLQEGRSASDGKPFGMVGAGVTEIRIHDVVEYRVMVVAKFPEAIYVLHAFVKRGAKTSRRDIAIARKRFRALLKERGPNEA